ncbi:MAG: hypothetical protein II467_02215, partial [Bacilli bacterium]|nr:hypothetical protein [Bacilli bacterium]
MKRINCLVISALAVLALVSCGSGQSSSSASSESSAATSSNTSSSSSSSESSSSASSSEASSSSREEGDYLFYKLKEGQTKDGLEGSPWVNSVKEGIGKKLVKPSEKDDFYLNKTYEMQNTAVLEPGDMAIGGMPGAIKEISKRTTKMLSEKTSSSYSDALNSVFNLYSKADKAGEEAY